MSIPFILLTICVYNNYYMYNIQSTHQIWAEKYRPQTIDQIILDDSIKINMSEYINNKSIPHLLLYSDKPGAGKTSLAKILVKEIPCDYLYINSSDENGIDFIRDKVIPFASTIGTYNIKIVILDEFDYTTLNAQSALRNLMEQTAEYTRFILTCNLIDRIFDPIRSRCVEYKIEPASIKSIGKYCLNILNSESISYEKQDVGKIIKNNYPDIRKIINTLQQSCIDKKLSFENNKILISIEEDIINILNNYLNNNINLNTIIYQIRTKLANTGLRYYENFYTMLYDNINKYCDINHPNLGDIILTIAKYAYENNFTTDKEITLMACFITILKYLKK